MPDLWGRWWLNGCPSCGGDVDMAPDGETDGADPGDETPDIEPGSCGDCLDCGETLEAALAVDGALALVVP